LESVSLSVQGLVPNEIGYLYEILLQVEAQQTFITFIFSYKTLFKKIPLCGLVVVSKFPHFLAFIFILFYVLNKSIASIDF